MNTQTGKRKHTIEEVRQLAESVGYELISTAYKNVHTPIEVRCPIHGSRFVRYTSMLKGSGCKACSDRKRGDNQRLTTKELERRIREYGYEPVDLKSYKDGNSKITVECKVHGFFITTFGVLRSGSGCPKCGIEKNRKSKSTPFSRALEIITNSGYSYDSGEYENQNSKINLVCPIHGIFESSIDSLVAGHGCQKCGHERQGKAISGENNNNWNGGITPLNIRLRQAILPWTHSCLKAKGYRSELSGKRDNLEVHHLTPFKDILTETLNELNLNTNKYSYEYTDKEIQQITDLFIKKHKSVDYLVLTKEEHRNFHLYCGGNHKPTTMKQFKEYAKTVI